MDGEIGFIAVVLMLMLFFKDMSGKNELRLIREELQKLNELLRKEQAK